MLFLCKQLKQPSWRFNSPCYLTYQLWHHKYLVVLHGEFLSALVSSMAMPRSIIIQQELSLIFSPVDMSLAQIWGIFSQFEVAGLIGSYKAAGAPQILLDEGELANERTTGSITQYLWQSSRKSMFILFVELVAFLALINICIIWIRWG